MEQIFISFSSCSEVFFQGELPPYVKLGAYKNEILSGVYAAVRKALAKRYLT